MSVRRTFPAIDLKEAFEIVLTLAANNMLTEKDIGNDSTLKQIRKVQAEAYNMVEEYLYKIIYIENNNQHESKKYALYK